MQSSGLTVLQACPMHPLPPALTRLILMIAGLPLLSAPAVTEPEVSAVWPLDPVPSVSHPFAPPAQVWESGHRGVDLAARPGQVVRAALPGAVGFAGVVAGKPVVTVLHGGRRTTYEPVVATVERGQPVAAGDPIGTLTVTDSHCFPAACLHWGLRQGDDYLDPLSLMSGGAVRLLPLWRDEPAVTPAGVPADRPYGADPS